MSEGKKERILTIQFDAEIAPHEIPLFRGAVLNTLQNQGEPVNILFHNHEGAKFRFSYPLVQYKRINKKAAIVCIGEGTDAIGEFLSTMDEEIKLGDRLLPLRVARILPQQFLIQVWDTIFSYSIRRWIPLNSSNYIKYSESNSIAEKAIILEKTLLGNILSFAKGIGVFFDDPVICRISSLSEPYLVKSKNIKMMAFDATFQSNVSLPDYVGLGKHSSMGFGVTTKQR